MFFFIEYVLVTQIILEERCKYKINTYLNNNSLYLNCITPKSFTSIISLNLQQPSEADKTNVIIISNNQAHIANKKQNLTPQFILITLTELYMERWL